MTVNTTSITSGPYLGNDTSDTFSYTFKITDKSEIKIFETDASGVETELVVDTDYTLTGIGDAAGGTAVRTAGNLPAGYTWYIRSDYDETQLTSFRSQGAFFPGLHEDAMDKLTFLIQQMLDKIGRTFRLSDSDISGLSLELPPPEPLKFVRVNAANTALEYASGTTSVLAEDVTTDTADLQTVLDSLSYPTVAAMVADTGLTIGMKVRTLGYYAAGDGGGNDYSIVAAGTGTVDGGSYIDLSGSGLQAKGLFAHYTVSVKQFGAKGDGINDDSSAIQAASTSFLSVFVPKGTYLTTSKISIRDSQTWTIDDAVFTQNGVDFTTVFEADDIADWSILGRVKCVGSLVTGADVGDENGLVIKGGSRYRVEGFTADVMRSHGIHVMAGASAPAPRGDQGQYSDCAAHKCRVGIEIDPASSAEFNVFSNFNAAGCLDGAIVGGGDSMFVGGNIVDNTRGVTLIAGSNHAHGAFVGTQINHNNTWNMKSVSVTNGHTFSGCHFYGNGGATSPIIFENSKGVSIDGGIVDCAIRCDGTTGQNAITSNYIPTSTPALFGTNPEYLRILGNWTDLGPFALNDPAPEYSLVSRGVSAQAIPTGTVIVFNSATKDKRSLYNTTTGVYTAPVTGVYTVAIDATITATSITTNGYLTIRVNGATKGYFTVVFVSATVAVVAGNIDIILAASDTVDIISNAPGTSPVLAINTSSLSINLQS